MSADNPQPNRTAMTNLPGRLKNRLLYPLRERLVCSEKEAIAMIVLLAVVFSGHVIRLVQAMHPEFDEITQAEMDSLFFLLSARADSAEGFHVPVGIDTIHVGYGATFGQVEMLDEGAQSWVLVDTLEKPVANFPINVNTADGRTLQALPRIGPAMAERILRYREDRGPFETADDLLGVRGIGPKTLEKLLPLITFTAEADSSDAG